MGHNGGQIAGSRTGCFDSWMHSEDQVSARHLIPPSILNDVCNDRKTNEHIECEQTDPGKIYLGTVLSHQGS